MPCSTRQTSGSTRGLAMDELRPSLHLAGCYHYRRNVSFQYRVPSHHLILIESGHIEAKTPNGTFEAGARDLICFRAADLNQYGTHTPTLYYQADVEFAAPPRDRLTPWLDGAGLLPVLVPLGESFEEMRQLFEVLCLEIQHTGVVHQLRIQAALYEMLSVIVRVVGPQEEKMAHLDPWLRVQQRMDTTLHSKVKIEELARQMNLSAAHFRRQFKNRFGLSAKAYHLRARMQEAAHSLRCGDQSIKTVACKFGFSDARSFARSFKHCLGLTPSDLRRNAAFAAETIQPHQRGFPINIHLLPPQQNGTSYERYLPKGRRLATNFAASSDVLDKIRHPEHYV